MILYWLRIFYQKMQNFEKHPLVHKNINQIVKRCNQFIFDFDMAIDVLKSNQSELTDFGASLLKLLEVKDGYKC